jgi:hypothetical protein
MRVSPRARRTTRGVAAGRAGRQHRLAVAVVVAAVLLAVGIAVVVVLGLLSGEPSDERTAPTESAATTGERTLTAYVSGYSYWDNTPPGAAVISHPVLHETAGGTGTYDDPVTAAVGHAIVDGDDVLDWPAGTRFYVPNLHRYFIVEDTCGDLPRPQDGPCHTGYPDEASTWIDVWVGGQDAPREESDDCMSEISQVSAVIVDPEPGYAVDAGAISDSGCREHGDAPQRAGRS